MAITFFATRRDGTDHASREAHTTAGRTKIRMVRKLWIKVYTGLVSTGHFPSPTDCGPVSLARLFFHA